MIAQSRWVVAGEKLLLRPEEAAELLSIGRSKVYELIGTGELVSVRIGASRRIPAQAIAEFVQQLQASPVPAQSIVQRG